MEAEDILGNKRCHIKAAQAFGTGPMNHVTLISYCVFNSNAHFCPTATQRLTGPLNISLLICALKHL